MGYFKLLLIAKFLYPIIIRPTLVKAVDDPNEEWDNVLLEIIDRLFNYVPKGDNNGEK